MTAEGEGQEQNRQVSHDPDRTRRALGLLRERGLNVFAGDLTPEEQE